VAKSAPTPIHVSNPAPAEKTRAAKPATTRRASTSAATNEMPIMSFATKKAWQTWLESHHATSTGVWLKLAKLGGGGGARAAANPKSVARSDALDVALCYGWIDGQAKGVDAVSWLQKFTPRRPGSIWSKINCEKVEALIESGAMRPAGLAEIEKAKQNGRWDAAYDGPRAAQVPADLQTALDRNAKAAAFFTTISSRNRYAILFRIHHAKKAETRARRIEQFVRMLEQHETIYP
jgi:uncharacterized protein YdeI (YjbR/CyaY-like superfamily)